MGHGVPRSHPAKAEAITSAFDAMIRLLKQANPQALTMMYSTAATANGDWRGNGVDLERIAGEGFLDIVVDQTWADAWGDVPPVFSSSLSESFPAFSRPL